MKTFSSLLIFALTAITAISPAAAAAAAKAPANGIPLVANNKNPTCKPWYAIRDTIMGGIFKGRCDDLARAAIRLAFHDAGTFSLALQAAGEPNGGADGSLLTDPNEVLRPENNGLQAIVAALKDLPAQVGQTPGDVLQLAGILAVLACPGGPQIQFLVGRTPPANIAPDGLLPDTNAPVASLTALFADKGFSIRELMALIGAHTTGTQQFVDSAFAGDSFDSTVDIWDVNFYRETQSPTNATGTFKLPSDANFAVDPSTQKDFSRFIANQDNWAREYANAHFKMSLLGQNQASMTDCTEILPTFIDITQIEAAGSPAQDPVVDPTKLEAAIEFQRSIWLD